MKINLYCGYCVSVTPATLNPTQLHKNNVQQSNSVRLTSPPSQQEGRVEESPSGEKEKGALLCVFFKENVSQNTSSFFF